MWSSTESAPSTISIENQYKRPNADDILNDCCIDRENYKPNILFDHKWGENILEENLLNENKKNLKLTNKIITNNNNNINICQHNNNNTELINIWANKNLYNDNRSLEQIYNDDHNHKKNTDLIKKRIHKTESHFMRTHNYVNFNDIPYIERSFCYPKIMVHLGTKGDITIPQMHRYIEHGISLFLIDLRFGSPTNHPKMIKRFENIRKNLNEIFPSKQIFGLAFLINGRRLEVGLLHKDQSIFLDRDSIVILTSDRRFSNRGTNNVIYINFSNYIEKFERNDEIKIGNEIIVIVQSKTINSIICFVKKDGLLKGRMLVKIPFNRYIFPPPIITKEENEDIALAIAMGCDYLISTCVTENLRSHIDWALAVNNRLVILLQKISFSQSPITKSIDEIDYMFNVSDGLYIHGGCPPNSYLIQKYAVQSAIGKQKVVIHAGFMMRKHKTKLDKEALKCLLLYPDCIVVSPILYDVTKIRPTIRSVYPEMNRDNFALSLSPLFQQQYTVEKDFCRQIILLSVCEKVSCIIIINNSGHFVRLLAENRPMVPIIASFLNSPFARNCLHSRNVYVNLYRQVKPPTWTEEVTLRLRSCIEYGLMIDCIHQNVPFIFCYNSRAELKFCNTVRILLKE